MTWADTALTRIVHDERLREIDESRLAHQLARAATARHPSLRRRLGIMLMRAGHHLATDPSIT